jgi:general stress protein 26
VLIASFAEIAEEFHARIARIAWATVATVGADGAPRTRILHPIWERQIGWIATGRQSLKITHLRREPRISLTYWDPEQDNVHIEAVATVVDDPADKDRVWDLFVSTPPPLGYDPILFWTGGKTDPTFGLLPDRVDRPAAPRRRTPAAGLASVPDRTTHLSPRA